MQWLDLRKLILKFKFSENEEKEEITEQLTFETVEINNLFNLNKCVNKLEKSGRISLNLDGELSFSDGKTNYVVTIAEGFFGDGVSMQDALSAIEPLLGDDCTTVVYDAKNVMYLLREYDLALNSPFEDVQLKGYLINPNRKVTDLKGLLADYRVDCAPAVGMLVLDGKLDEKLSELSLSSLYRDMELPLVKVLFDMETQGFCIDIKLLEELSKQYDDELKELTEKIYDEAGERNFNINSTKQLASLLFDKLNLQHGKKGKTGNYSVAADILAEIDHPIAKYLLRYREISKLKSTYIDGMRQVMNKTTGRVHTCFKQCLTVTGRLSSTEPNLQNIPVRTAEGREIRKMFVPEKGNLLVCSDYSQIELRLMASFSGDETLINSFKSGEDIHAVTASKMFGVPLNTVSQQMRRAAKAVNFGVIYGISGFGLSSNLDISQYEAQRYIRDYFIEHPKVREYMDSNVELAKRDGYLRTLFGRLRFFPELKSPKYQERAFAERAAMNMPLQGSAADIIKIAMLKVDKLLRERGLKSKLILQVHDELIVDAPEEEAERVKSLLIEGMESAVNLAVPLTVNVDVGKNWFEAK